MHINCGACGNKYDLTVQIEGQIYTDFSLICCLFCGAADQSSKEVRTVWNEPSKEGLAKIPRLYETEDIPLGEKLVHLHFFIGKSDWYIAEYDGEDIFFGYAILNGDSEMAEWGYISFRELRELKIPPGFEVECDRFWKVRKAKVIEKIRL